MERLTHDETETAVVRSRDMADWTHQALHVRVVWWVWCGEGLTCGEGIDSHQHPFSLRSATTGIHSPAAFLYQYMCMFIGVAMNRGSIA